MSQTVRTVLVRMPSSAQYAHRVEQLLAAWQDERGFRLVLVPADASIDRVLAYVERFEPIHAFVCLELSDDEEPADFSVLGSIPLVFSPVSVESARWLNMMGYSTLWDGNATGSYYVYPLECPFLVWEVLTDTDYYPNPQARPYLVLCLMAGKDGWEHLKVLENAILDRPGIRILPISDYSVYHLSNLLSQLHTAPDAIMVTHFDRRVALRDASRIVPSSTRLVLVMERENYSRDWTGRYRPLISTGSGALPSYLAVGRFEDPTALCDAVGV